jgi:hypothetical protein
MIIIIAIIISCFFLSCSNLGVFLTSRNAHPITNEENDVSGNSLVPLRVNSFCLDVKNMQKLNCPTLQIYALL